MIQDFLDNWWILDGGNDAHLAAAQVAGLNVDPEYPLEESGPAGAGTCHLIVGFWLRQLGPGFWHHHSPVLKVRRKDAGKAGQVDPGPRHEKVPIETGASTEPNGLLKGRFFVSPKGHQKVTKIGNNPK